MLERHSNVAKPAGVPHLRGQQQGGPPQALLQGGPHHHPRPLPQEAYNMTTWHTPNTHTEDPFLRYAASVNFCRVQQLAFFLD